MPRQRQQRQPSPAQQRQPTAAQLAARERFAQMARERAAARGGTSKRAGSVSSRQPRQATATSTITATSPTSSRPATLTGGSADYGLSSDLAAELGLAAGTQTAELDEGADTYGDSEPDDDEQPAAAPAEGANQGAVEASTLEAVFNSIAGTADDPHRKHRDQKRSARAARRSRHKANRPSAKAESDGKTARSTPVQRALEKKESLVDAAAEQWYDVAGFLFILCMGWLMGDDLAPTEDQAFDITSPLVRIAIRHYDPLQKASADAADVTEAMLALVLYLKVTWPAIQEKRRAKQAERTRTRQQRHNERYVQAVQRVPIAAEPADYAAAAARRAGYDTDATGSRGSDVYERSSDGDDRYSPEAILNEYGVTAAG